VGTEKISPLLGIELRFLGRPDSSYYTDRNTPFVQGGKAAL
jgi:hypothetical protein